MKGDVHWYVAGVAGEVAADAIAEVTRSGPYLVNSGGVAAVLNDTEGHEGDRIEMASADLLRHVERSIDSDRAATVQLWHSDEADTLTTIARVPSWNALHIAFSLDGLTPGEATELASSLFAATLRTTHATVLWAVDRTGITEIYGDPHDWDGEQQPGWPPRTD